MVLWWNSLLRQNAGDAGILPFCLFRFILFQIQVPGRAHRLAQLETQACSFVRNGPCQTVSIREEEAPQKEICVLLGRGQKLLGSGQYHYFPLFDYWANQSTLCLCCLNWFPCPYRVPADIFTLFLKLLPRHQSFVFFLFRRPQFCFLHPFILSPFLPLNFLCAFLKFVSSSLSWSYTLLLHISCLYDFRSPCLPYTFSPSLETCIFQRDAAIQMTPPTPPFQHT